jgi:hypothetical protein
MLSLLQAENGLSWSQTLTCVNTSPWGCSHPNTTQILGRIDYLITCSQVEDLPNNMLWLVSGYGMNCVTDNPSSLACVVTPS